MTLANIMTSLLCSYQIQSNQSEELLLPFQSTLSFQLSNFQSALSFQLFTFQSTLSSPLYLNKRFVINEFMNQLKRKNILIKFILRSINYN
jgi:hypothetical protein